MSQVYILTLKLNPELQLLLNELRRHYFPLAINYLDAHVTLFHALPGDRTSDWSRDLVEIVNKQSQFKVEIDRPYLLGRGVGLKVIAPEITPLHRALQSGWLDYLTPQDRQKRSAHVTVQNKVEPAEARRTLQEISKRWSILQGWALGVSVYEYLGGPWQFERDIPFKAQTAP